MDSYSSENRNNRIIAPSIRSKSCCSFCKQSGHNITRCNSDRLLEFEIMCATEVRSFESQYDFKIWLNQNYINNKIILKAFAIRKMNVNSKTSIDDCINKISDYIFKTYKNFTNIQQEDTIDFEEDINDLQDDLIRFLDEIRNRRQREMPQEFYENPNFEQSALREYNIALSLQDIFFQVRESHNDNKNINIITKLLINEDEEINEICKCNICWDEKEIKNFVKLGCNHEFCKDCVINTLKIDQMNNPCCALCRKEITSINSRIEIIHNEISELIL